MEITILIVLIGLLTLALYGIDAHRREKRRRFILKENMPEELQTARLVASEHYISTVTPRRMHGALDQLYKLASKKHVLTDTKTRKDIRVYKKDIVQISVYRTILQRKGYDMADYAYFRMVTPEGVFYPKHRLLTEEQVVEEYDRTKQVLARKVTPKYAEHKGMCAGCAQQSNCDKWQFAN